MTWLLEAILAQVIIRHEEEAKPNRKGEAQHPGEHDAPEDPVGHAEDQADVLHVPAVTEDVRRADAPAEGKRPDDQNDETFVPRMAQQPLLLAGVFGRLAHVVRPYAAFRHDPWREVYLGPEVTQEQVLPDKSWAGLGRQDDRRRRWWWRWWRW